MQERSDVNLKGRVLGLRSSLEALVESLPECLRPSRARVYDDGARYEMDFDDGLGPPWPGEWDNSFNDTFKDKFGDTADDD